MKFSKHEQGTPEWLEERKTKVTASDAAVINGTNTFGGNSPLKLYQKKFDIGEEEEVNEAMKEGNRLEVDALKWFNKEYSTSFIKPNGGYHDTYEWMMASLDGYDEENKKYIVEIKCGPATYEKALEGIVPPYYYDQIQHQLFVSNREICYYVAYRPDKGPIVNIVERDHNYFEILFAKEKEFYDCMVNLIPPGLAEKEFLEIIDASATEIARKWLETKEILKNAEKMEKVARESLKDVTDGGNCVFPDAGVKVEMRTRKGLVDYTKVCKEYGIKKGDLEKYRKPSSSGQYPLIIKEA